MPPPEHTAPADVKKIGAGVSVSSRGKATPPDPFTTRSATPAPTARLARPSLAEHGGPARARPARSGGQRLTTISALDVSCRTRLVRVAVTTCIMHRDGEATLRPASR